MAESLSNRQLARLCAVFFVVAGGIGCLRGWLSPNPEIARALLFPAAGLAVALGTAAWFAPWNRWPRGALLSLALGAFGLKALANLAGGTGPYIYIIHYLVLFMWCGVALPRPARLACVPLFLLSYVAPILFAGNTEADLASLGVVLPACVMLGELAAWIASRTRMAEQAARERAAKMATLVDATLSLAACQDLDELGRLTASGAAHLLGERSSLVMLRAGDSPLRAVGALDWKGPPGELPAEALAELHASLRHRAQGLHDPLVCDRLARAFGIPALEAVTLQGSSDPVGIVLIGREEARSPLDEFTQYVLQTFATQAGLGFERLHAAAALRDESLRDPLTGVGNRRKAAAALEVLKQGDVLVLIDLDHFKQVNDGFGHHAGDRVLRTLAEYLRSCVRPPDEVFRFGGEEFLLVLCGGGDGGLTAVERIHAGWQGQHRVTSWSAGLAARSSDESAEAVLVRADAALYTAKREGRNRVIAWREGLATHPFDEDSPASF